MHNKLFTISTSYGSSHKNKQLCLMKFQQWMVFNIRYSALPFSNDKGKWWITFVNDSISGVLKNIKFKYLKHLSKCKLPEHYYHHWILLISGQTCTPTLFSMPCWIFNNVNTFTKINSDPFRKIDFDFIFTFDLTCIQRGTEFKKFREIWNIE